MFVTYASLPFHVAVSPNRVTESNDSHPVIMAAVPVKMVSPYHLFEITSLLKYANAAPSKSFSKLPERLQPFSNVQFST